VGNSPLLYLSVRRKNMTREKWKKIRGSSDTPDHIMLSIKGDAATQRTVKWRTDASAQNGYVCFRRVDESEYRRQEALCNTFETDVDYSSYFFADMTGLEPDTEYVYFVATEKGRSEEFSFRTSSRGCDKFSFLCLSDIQTGGPEPPADYTEFGAILKKILKEHPECEFILTAGDNTNCGQTDVQWTGLMEGLRGVCESIPVQLCMGNHDDMGFADYFTFTGKYYSEHATYFTNQLLGSYDDNGPEGWKVPNYSFDYGNCSFWIMGTSGFEEINDWLLATTKNSSKTWKFGAHHFPVCYAGPEIECEDTYPALRDGMETLDIVFSGHEHSFARSYPRRKDGLYDKPSEGTIHYNIGSGNRNPPGTRVVPKVWNAKTYEHEENLSMFSVVDIDGDKCTLTAYVEDGRIVDRCVIDKGSDSISPFECAPRYNRPRLKFKGYDPGICMNETMPVKIDDLWYICPGQLAGFIGATAVRSEGKIRIEVYGRFAEYTENSDIMLTDKGEMKMQGRCLRLERDQLFIPVEALSPLRMHPLYFEHNNFISVESETEAKPVPYQP